MRGQIYLIALIIVSLFALSILINVPKLTFAYHPSIEKYIALDIKLQILKINNTTQLDLFLGNTKKICSKHNMECSFNQTNIFIKSWREEYILER